MTGQTQEHEHCLRPGCGRRLYCKASRARGYGWGCWRRIRAAAKAEALATRLAAFTARQVEQVRELIEDAAIIPGAIAGQFFAVSTDGEDIYQVTVDGCSCPSAKECYHLAAVAILTAGEPEMATTGVPMPDLAVISPAAVWLACFRRNVSWPH
jgi:hypothetical protein